MRIRIEGPSSPFRPEALAAGVALLRELGHDVDVGGDDDNHSGLRGRHGYLNGSDDERRAGLETALASDVDVIWLARGGYGLTRIVDDLVVPAGRIPVVVGFSDATALFARLAGAGHLDRCVHGPLATTLAAEPESSAARALQIVARRAAVAATTDDARTIQAAAPLPALRVVDGTTGGSGMVSGWLWAGNLVVLAALCGTPSMPSLDGAIVVLEEVGERPYRLDRLLTQLHRAGAFAGVRAFVVGHLTGCNEPVPPATTTTTTTTTTTRDPAPTGLDVVISALRPFGVPIATGLACGHEAPNFALPLGGQAMLVVGELQDGDGDHRAATLVADG